MLSTEGKRKIFQSQHWGNWDLGQKQYFQDYSPALLYTHFVTFHSSPEIKQHGRAGWRFCFIAPSSPWWLYSLSPCVWSHSFLIIIGCFILSAQSHYFKSLFHTPPSSSHLVPPNITVDTSSKVEDDRIFQALSMRMSHLSGLHNQLISPLRILDAKKEWDEAQAKVRIFKVKDLRGSPSLKKKSSLYFQGKQSTSSESLLLYLP